MSSKMSKAVRKIKNLQLTLFGFFQVFLYLLVGEYMSLLIPLPPAIIGLLLCCGACLLMKKVPLSLDLASRFLLKNMAIFFIPYIVTISLFWLALAGYWFACLLALFISTLLTLIITSVVSDKLIERIVNTPTKEY
jgi:holin-like protein